MTTNGSDDDQTRSFTNLAADTKVSHYTIISKIGAGGMGEVYLAKDTQLDRKVALKFLPPHLSQDEAARARFTREAKAAAKLDHPNIVQVFEVGEYQSRPFFAMAHIEGKSLREVIKEGKLSINEAVDLTKQLCEGLHEAHNAGVIHRDVKPGNIIIDKKGKPRLLDFGLAKVSGEEKLTKTGSTLGTVGYMSPEQIEGKKVDHRSDLFSVGVILYEMLTGRRPFEGDTGAAVVKAITDTTPEPIARYKSGTTGELQQVVDKALTKAPTLRYQHADGMLTDLKRLEIGSGMVMKSRLGLWAAVAALVILAGYFAVDHLMIPDEETVEGWTNSVAVLVFRNISGDPEQDYFCEGMTDEIIGRLGTIKGLKVTSMQSMLQFKGTDLDLKKIGKELDVENVLEGRIQISGDDIRVRAQLIRVDDDAHIWTEKYDREITSVFDIQDEISRAIANVLETALVGGEESFLSRRGTDNIEAYNEYIRGRHFWRKRNEEGMTKAIGHFQNAAKLDPGFAAAYCGLSDGWSMLARYGYLNQLTGYSKADTFSLRALELDPNLAEAHTSRGWALYLQGEYGEAEKHFLKAIELNPGYVWSHQWYNNLLRDLGRHEEYITELNIAYQLDPLCPSVLHTMAIESNRSGELEKTKELYETILEIEPSHPESYMGLAQAYLDTQDTTKALEITDLMIQRLPANWKSFSKKGWILGQLGRFDEAREAHEKAIEIAPNVWNTHSTYGWFLDTWRFFDEAAEQFRLAMELDSSQFDGYLGLAWVLRRMGKSNEAGLYLKSAIELGPYSARTHRHYGMFLENVKGDIDEAIKYYSRAVELNPRYAWGYQALANANATIGRYDEALKAIEKAIELLPTESYFVLCQGGYLAEAGRLDSAVATYQAYLTMDQKPFYAFVARRIADIYVVNCRYEQADSIYSLSDGYPDSIQRGQGRLEAVNPLLHQGRFNEALVQLKKGIEIDQAELGYSEPMCWKYDRQGLIKLLFLDDPESALADYRLAEKVHETLPSKTRSQAASIYGAQVLAIAAAGEISEAKKMLEKAVEQTAPNEADLQRAYNFYLAYIHRLAGRFDESARLMEVLVNEEPNFINQLYLGESYLGAARVDEAVLALEKAMARYDDSRFNSWGQSVMGHYYLGRAFETAKRTEEAIEQYETFLDIWKNGDEGLKSVEDARERLARLKETI